jgi:N6-L-threonylcarbamoyladenine synthase
VTDTGFNRGVTDTGVINLPTNKGGIRKANQTPKFVFGYQLFDRVLYSKQEAFIFGRRSSGSFDIRKLDGTKLNAGVGYKKLRHIEYRTPLLISYL